LKRAIRESSNPESYVDVVAPSTTVLLLSAHPAPAPPHKKASPTAIAGTGLSRAVPT
jgi:hypothetical protein